MMSVTFELAVVLVAVTLEPETGPVVKPAVKVPLYVPSALLAVWAVAACVAVMPDVNDA